MKFGAFFFGGVEMTDAGAGLPNPMDRRYDNAACWKATLDYIDGDATLWEQEPLKGLAHDGELMAFDHHGFWQPMDTLRDRDQLQALWDRGRAPWKIW